MGGATFVHEEDDDIPYGLGYEIDETTECQLTPRRVDALSQERVLGVALGNGFILAVTDAGADRRWRCLLL